MTKQQRADLVRRQLDELYPETAVPLEHQDPFTLLVAVVLSAQCTDKRVNMVTPDLFKKANTPQQMARLRPRQIQSLIKSCGLSNTKSKNIHALSKMLMEKHDGRVPQTFEELEALPGVGHKTASVVMAQAHGQHAFPVDTHIHRLAKRWKFTRGKNVKETERDLKKLFPPAAWHKVHLQIIFYGRQFCTARGCDGTRCPICRALARKR